jgi:nicotinate-nucleotide--dimethylbenzimidazole phosphoribosyltransferase
MLESLGRGVAAINVLARAIDADFEVIDVGTNQPSSNPDVHSERIACGTKDLSSGPAMSVAQAQHAIQTGRNYARRALARGANLIVAGEVGIANTTSAACVIAALLKIDSAEIVGHGSGVSDAVLTHKVRTVRTALARAPSSASPIQLLAEYGGFEIAAMTGAYLEAARWEVPSLLDGFISAAAALVGCALEPNLRHWLLASHRSAERGHRIALTELELDPLIDLGMRLGEGTGAAVAIPLLQAAIKLHAEMATFAEAGVPDGT